MKKLLFKIKDSALYIKEKVRLSCENKNLLNTNVISSDELIFSLDYLNNNVKITSTFINELTKNYGIDTIIIEKMEFVSTILNGIKK